jgi:aspartate kinase
MFQILAEHGINIQIVTTSEIKVSVLIDRDSCDAAVKAIHDGFALHELAALAPTTEARSAGVAARPTPHDEEIVARLSGMEDIVVSDITTDTDQARITVSGLPDSPGVAARVFAVIAEAGFLVDMIIQDASNAGNASISLTVPKTDADAATNVLKTSLKGIGYREISCDPDVGKLTVSGIGLRSHTDVAARVFRVLSDEKINVQLVNTSEIKISILMTPEEVHQAKTALLNEFQLSS